MSPDPSPSVEPWDAPWGPLAAAVPLFLIASALFVPDPQQPSLFALLAAGGDMTVIVVAPFFLLPFAIAFSTLRAKIKKRPPLFWQGIIAGSMTALFAAILLVYVALATNYEGPRNAALALPPLLALALLVLAYRRRDWLRWNALVAAYALTQATVAAAFLLHKQTGTVERPMWIYGLAVGALVPLAGWMTVTALRGRKTEA